MFRFVLGITAFAAQAKNREVIQVGDESVFFVQRLDERQKDALVHLEHLMAVAADQVMVVRVQVDFVLYAPVTKVGWVNETETREQIERPVDRRLVDVRILFAYAREDLVGGQVAGIFADDGQNHLALGRQPMPFFPQLVDKCRVMHK